MKLPSGTKKVIIDIESGDVDFVFEQLEVKEPVERWRAELGENYWTFDRGGACELIDFNDSYDEEAYSNGFYFQTKQQAEQAYNTVSQYLLSWNGK